MSTYVIIQSIFTNPEGMSEYREKVPATVEKHGGRYISRGPPVEKLEGDTQLANVVAIVEFPSIERAKAWYSDPEYAPLIKIRQSAAISEIILADGV